MSGTGNHMPKDTPVDPPINTMDGDASTSTQDGAKSERVTTPIDITDLSNTLSKSLVED